jgi:hypothetical protein
MKGFDYYMAQVRTPDVVQAITRTYNAPTTVVSSKAITYTIRAGEMAVRFPASAREVQCLVTYVLGHNLGATRTGGNRKRPLFNLPCTVGELAAPSQPQEATA